MKEEETQELPYEVHATNRYGYVVITTHDTARSAYDERKEKNESGHTDIKIIGVDKVNENQ